jgi:hypothetical protein
MVRADLLARTNVDGTTYHYAVVPQILFHAGPVPVPVWHILIHRPSPLVGQQLCALAQIADSWPSDEDIHGSVTACLANLRDQWDDALKVKGNGRPGAH